MELGGVKLMAITRTRGYFARALGLAVVKLWSELPRHIQHAIFEEAVISGHRSERDENLREQLAAFLHETNHDEVRHVTSVVPDPTPIER
jgi:hypothetical protein